MAVDQWGPSVGLFDLPTNRLINWLHFKALSMVEWDEDGKNYTELSSALDWPDVAADADLTRSDQQARASLASMGIPMPTFSWPDGQDAAEIDG
jgi:hypothetical protein